MSPGQHALDAAQMPRYQCHKKVWALQVRETQELKDDDGNILGMLIIPVELGYERFRVQPAVIARYRPKPGDYFVTYEDGYTSFSPQYAFEEGYTRL